MLAVIDRQSATGKRDYAMILATARLGLRISICATSSWATWTGGRKASRSSSTRRAGR